MPLLRSCLTFTTTLIDILGVAIAIILLPLALLFLLPVFAYRFLVRVVGVWLRRQMLEVMKEIEDVWASRDDIFADLRQYTDDYEHEMSRRRRTSSTSSSSSSSLLGAPDETTTTTARPATRRNDERNGKGVFPMHQLCLQPAMLILNELTAMDILEISLTSPEGRDIARQFFSKISPSPAETELAVSINEVFRKSQIKVRLGGGLLEIHVICGTISRKAVKEGWPSEELRWKGTTMRNEMHKPYFYGHFESFWKDPLHGVVTWTDHLSHVFDSHVTSISILDPFADRIDEILDRLVQFDKPMTSFQLDGLVLKSDARRILDQSENVRDVKFDGQQMLGFTYTGRLRTRGALELASAHWLTGDNLLEMSAEDVRIEACFSNISDRDLNRYLKHWLEGDDAACKLKTFSIILDDFLDLDTLIDGVQVVESEKLEKMSKEQQAYWEHVETTTGDYSIRAIETMFKASSCSISVPLRRQRFDVRRDVDGRNASVFLDNRLVFWIYVWPEKFDI